MMKKKIKRFQEGGMSEDEAKAAGLEASKEDKVGFLERLRMGNIDDEGSEAYKRFGAGRGRAARIPVEDRVGTPVEEIRARDVSKSAAPATVPDDMMVRGVAEGMRKGSGDASVAEMYSGPRAKPIEASAQAVTSSPAAGRSSSSAAPKKQNQAVLKASGAPAPVTSKQNPDSRRTEGDSSGVNKTRAAPAYSPPPMTDEMRKKAESQAISPYYPEELLGGFGLKALASAAKRLANFSKKPGSYKTAEETLALPAPTKRLGYDMKTLPAPTKRLEYDKAGAVAQRRADRSAARDAEMKAENTAATSRAADRKKSEELASELRKGQAKTKFTSQSKAPSKRTKKLDDSDAGVEFKRGGSVSPASKRADGIAVRGKTRCKMR